MAPDSTRVNARPSSSKARRPCSRRWLWITTRSPASARTSMTGVDSRYAPAAAATSASSGQRPRRVREDQAAAAQRDGRPEHVAEHERECGASVAKRQREERRVLAAPPGRAAPRCRGRGSRRRLRRRGGRPSPARAAALLGAAGCRSGTAPACGPTRTSARPGTDRDRLPLDEPRALAQEALGDGPRIALRRLDQLGRAGARRGPSRPARPQARRSGGRVPVPARRRHASRPHADLRVRAATAASGSRAAAARLRRRAPARPRDGSRNTAGVAWNTSVETTPRSTS